MSANWPANNMLEAAWGLIANAHHGDWDLESDEWQKAARDWRDAYHAQIKPGDLEAEQP